MSSLYSSDTFNQLSAAVTHLGYHLRYMTGEGNYVRLMGKIFNVFVLIKEV